jgi:RimJ/RimL family protein N-acetyltransferase
MIDPENSASLRVAAKLGYREMTRADYKTSQVVLFERRSP